MTIASCRSVGARLFIASPGPPRARAAVIAQKKLEGYTNQEIAQELKCTLRTVERKLERIRTYWGRTEE